MFDDRTKKDIDNIILVVFILVSTSLLTDVFYSIMLVVSSALGIDITEWASNNNFFWMPYFAVLWYLCLVYGSLQDLGIKNMKTSFL